MSYQTIFIISNNWGTQNFCAMNSELHWQNPNVKDVKKTFILRRKKKEYKLHFRPHSHTVIYLMFSAGERVELQPSKTCIHSQTHNMIDTLCRLLDLAYLKQGHAMPISNFTWQLGQETKGGFHA